MSFGLVIHFQFIFVIAIGYNPFVLILGYLHIKEFAVSSLVGRETFYQKLGPTLGNFTPRHYENEEYKTRLEICKAILSSPLFSYGYHTVFINPNADSTCNYIRENQPLIYQRHYYNSSEDIQPRFNNPYEWHHVSILGENKQEHVFVCLAEVQDQKQTVVEYYISQDYDLSYYSQDLDVVNWGPTGARFVFAKNKDENAAMNIIAIAEEAAFISHFYSESEVQDKFLCNTKGEECHCLSTMDRIRLCTILFTVEELRASTTIRYCPFVDNIEPECVERNVTLYYGAHRETKFIKSWWMLECKARHIPPHSTTTFESYYISYDRWSNCKYKFHIFQRQYNTTTLIGSFKSQFLHYNPNYINCT